MGLRYEDLKRMGRVQELIPIGSDPEHMLRKGCGGFMYDCGQCVAVVLSDGEVLLYEDLSHAPNLENFEFIMSLPEEVADDLLAVYGWKGEPIAH